MKKRMDRMASTAPVAVVGFCQADFTGFIEAPRRRIFSLFPHTREDVFPSAPYD
jgi:hypothetical protein